MKLPPLLYPLRAYPEESLLFNAEEIRAIQREAARAALEAAAERCRTQATAAYKRYRAESSPYDDGGCDMASALEADIRNMEIEE